MVIIQGCNFDQNLNFLKKLKHTYWTKKYTPAASCITQEQKCQLSSVLHVTTFIVVVIIFKERRKSSAFNTYLSSVQLLFLRTVLHSDFDSFDKWVRSYTFANLVLVRILLEFMKLEELKKLIETSVISITSIYL